MFLNKNNEIVFNEVNTIPGFTQHSRFPRMKNAVGISFEKLVETLIELGINADNE
jgi:D-alanine---D-serine ligase